MEAEKKSLYRKIVPKFIRKPLSDHHAKKAILNYYDSLPGNLVSEEEKEALRFLQNHKLCVFPYPFQYNYKRSAIKVYQDDKLNLKYVLFEGKRLYFRRKSSSRGVRRNFNYLLISIIF